MKTGQTHVHRSYSRLLLDLIEKEAVDTTFMISHRASLERRPDMYKHWHDEQNDYTKIVLKPAWPRATFSQQGAEYAGA